MSKHSKYDRDDYITVHELYTVEQSVHRSPTAQETFAALGVVLVLLALVAAVGALIAAVVV